MLQTTPLDAPPEKKKQPLEEKVYIETAASEIINASGHRDQLRRQYGILSICGMALTVDNAWVAIGTSMNVAICELHASSNQT
jgi:hypothetical protein